MRSSSRAARAFDLAVENHRNGRLAEAEVLYRQVSREDPNHANALYLLGALALGDNRPGAAVDFLERAVSLVPDNPFFHSNLGVAYRRVARPTDAVRVLEHAVALKPGVAQSHVNLGLAYLDQEDLDRAAESFEAARELDPKSSSAEFFLARALVERGEGARAIQHYRRAIALDPKDVSAHTNLVYALSFQPELDAGAILAEARRWCERHAAGIQPYRHENEAMPDKRLRIGYVSPNFREHCQAFFLLPLLRYHDRQNFEIYGYASVRKPDAVTEQLRAMAEWRDVVTLDDVRTAERVREDRIDILVDLTMHMAETRLALFARKPAPVQVTWLAYPGTTGLPAMDYRLSDVHIDPAHLDSSERYSERTIRLPDTFWCYDPSATAPPVGPLPAISNGRVTFGCLNHFAKTNEATFELWASVLRAVPDSTLILLAPTGRARDRVRSVFETAGVKGDRVAFERRTPRDQYLRHYHRIDISLDTVPYNGHTTSLDALWMGVPVVTLVGRTVVGRAGYCYAKNLGLPDLVAESSEEYVSRCVELANDIQRLRELRAQLRSRLEASALMDAPRFAVHVEAAYREMWRTWCANHLAARTF